MSEFNLEQATAILSKTPTLLKTWLADLPEEWTQAKQGPDGWSVYDILGHYVHGEKTDWIARAQIILERQNGEFVPFDRFAQFDDSQGKSLGDLLEEFEQLRKANIETLKGFNLQPEDLDLPGRHPELGHVNLRQLLSTWVVHDLEHLSHICQVMARRYQPEVGVWEAYLGILKT